MSDSGFEAPDIATDRKPALAPRSVKPRMISNDGAPHVVGLSGLKASPSTADFFALQVAHEVFRSLGSLLAAGDDSPQ
jgi:hypothetical protein